MTSSVLLDKLKDIRTPAYVLDEVGLARNLEVVAGLREKAGVKVLLALKAFALFEVFPLMRRYLDGTTASGLYEARLGHEEFGGEVHVYSPAFEAEEIEGLIPISSHISFNSPAQFHAYRERIKRARPEISLGLRINPEFPLRQKEGFDIYNPCAPGSRMGILRQYVDEATLSQIEGLHFHVLCENMAEDSIRLIDFIEEKFGGWLRQVKWINFGGGHYLNCPGYDVGKLAERLIAFRNAFPHLDVVLEPGGGIVYNTGYLVATVLDVIENEKNIVLLDTSAEAHMPTVLEVPYVPDVIGAGAPGTKAWNAVLAGKSCMTADVIGDYSFEAPLKAGDRVIFEGMEQYTMVQNTTFNGLRLPDIAVLRQDGRVEVVRSFGYEDFKGRLG
jgi:carboxynorspermidine decarboxylase